MTVLLKLPSGIDGYRHIVQEVLDHGIYRAPRGDATLEISNMTIELASPYNALPLGVGRGLNKKIAAAEALQLIGAFSDPKLMPEAFERFKEPDGTFWGAYGTRVGYQLNQVFMKLRDDRYTRRAIITLWDPTKDNTPDKRDYPCTVALAFSIVNNYLNMTVLMRSNDVWLGLPYDMFQFTQLQLTLAGALNISPGTYTHTAWSMHIYEKDIEAAQKLHPVRSDDEDCWKQPTGIGMFDSGIAARKMRAKILAYPDHNELLNETMTESERWYRELFVPSEVVPAQLG